MHILRLRVSNFAGLKKYDEAFGKTTVLQGPNGSGKSSVLEAVKAIFRGADPKKIHVGEDRAEVIVELDGLKASRTITPNGARLTVLDGNGADVKRPQEYLNGVIGDFSFNPVDVFRLKSKELTAAILKALHLKAVAADVKTWIKEAQEKKEVDLKQHGLQVIAELREYYYSLRANVNAIVDRTKKTLETLKENLPPGIKPTKVDTKKLATLREQLSSAMALKTKRDNLQTTGSRLKEDVAHMEKQIQDLQAALVSKGKALEQARNDYKKIQVPNEKPLRDEIADIEKAQTAQFELDNIAKTEAQMIEAAEKAETYNTVVKRLSGPAIEELMEKANLPIKGLSFEDGEFYLKDVAISELSSSEKIKFATALVKALNKDYKIKVMFLDDIEVLTPKVRAEFLQTAEKDGFQYLVCEATEETKGLKTLVKSK